MSDERESTSCSPFARSSDVRDSSPVIVPAADGAVSEGPVGDSYYIFHDGVQYGPSPLGLLHQWLRDGNLDQTSLVWDSDQSLWVVLATFPPFLALKAPAELRGSEGTRQATRVLKNARPRPPEEARAVTGTTVYTTGFRNGKERRNALRLPVALKLDFHVLDPRTRQPTSLLYSYALDNISNGGFGFSIFGTDIQAGSWIRSWIELEPENGIVALGEVVRVRGRRTIGVGFRDVSDHARLEEFLTRRRP